MGTNIENAPLVRMVDNLGREWVASQGGGNVVAERAHEEIHEGKHFCALGSKDIANGANFQFLIDCPFVNEVPHVVFTIESLETEMDITLKEDVSVVGNGTSIPLINNNRNSSNTARLNLYHTPNTPTGGTLILPSYGTTFKIGLGKKLGDTYRSDEEILFKKISKYLLTIENNSGSDGRINFHFCHYESTIGANPA